MINITHIKSPNEIFRITLHSSDKLYCILLHELRVLSFFPPHYKLWNLEFKFSFHKTIFNKDLQRHNLETGSNSSFIPLEKER